MTKETDDRSSNLSTGLLFVLGGGLLAIGASGYRIGTAREMGPGYFPLALGILLTIIGATLVIRAMPRDGRVETDWLAPWKLGADQFRSLALITLAIVLFGALLKPLGLILAIMLLVTVSSFAGTQVRPVRVVATAVMLTVLSYAIFVKAIGLHLPLFPGVLAWG